LCVTLLSDATQYVYIRIERFTRLARVNSSVDKAKIKGSGVLRPYIVHLKTCLTLGEAYGLLITKA